MSKAYVVSGVDEESYKVLVKVFTDFNKAEKYERELIDEEVEARWMAQKCSHCNGDNKNCPFYLESDSTEIKCEYYKPYHDNITYYIEEVDFEE